LEVTHTGQVVYSGEISAGIVLLRIKLIEPNFVDFKAGQYVSVVIPASDKVAYYSIASSPNRKDEIELLIKEDKLGAGATYLYSLKEKDVIRLTMPMGDAYLREESDRNVIFVAGASGASYIRSMIHYLDESGQMMNREIHYFFGCRQEDELFESDDMHALSDKYAGFHYHPALSDQAVWKGHTGLITEVVAKLMQHDMSEWEAYSAGSPAMVKAVADLLLTKNNLMPDRFFSDMYTPKI